ncbi:MAG: hypothetical protein R6X23_07660 [Acidimicrobiia bacterium]
MGMIDNADSVREKAQARVAEPIVAVGFVQPAGTWGAAGLMQISGLAGILKQKDANTKAAELNTRGSMFKSNRQTLIVLTAAKLYAFEAKNSWGGIKLLDQLAEWDRKDVAIQVADGKISKRLTVDHAPSGGHYELEVTTAGTRGFNDAFLAEIARGKP